MTRPKGEIGYPDLEARLDARIVRQREPGPGRPEAIWRLLDRALTLEEELMAHKLEKLLASEAEADRLEREQHEITEYTRQANQAWRDRWPNHCKSCGGWGGELSDPLHPAESVWMPCEALPPEVCHRCGFAGLNLESGDGPRRFCGWDQDNGLAVTYVRLA
jgi:hypothetical protein